MPLDPADRAYWPTLRDEDFVETSEDTAEYNCIAHAAYDDTAWWWPSMINYWPPGVPVEVTLAAFAQAYATLDYGVCSSHAVEAGFEKIAIYADANGHPTHAARQLPGGRWTSKLGSLIDIEHADLDCLEGGDYGQVSLILRRPCART